MAATEVFTTSRGSLRTKLFSPAQETEDGAVKRLAVFLHPWSPLGGNMFDPVLRDLIPVFLSRKFHVLLYNSRPSLTGIAEGQDLRELVLGTMTKLGGTIEHLVVMGYSHGSLIASLHPLLPEPVKTSHLLLCYPLSVRGLITFFQGGTFETTLRDLVRDPRSHVFILYGDNDQFTSVEKYDKWVAQLTVDARGQLQANKIRGADHFWIGMAGEQMRAAVGLWLDGA